MSLLQRESRGDGEDDGNRSIIWKDADAVYGNAGLSLNQQEDYMSQLVAHVSLVLVLPRPRPQVSSELH